MYIQRYSNFSLFKLHGNIPFKNLLISQSIYQKSHCFRMMFWNYYFPILRDYPLVYEPPSPKCDDWEMVQKSWTFWTLVSILSSFAFFLTIFLTCRVRRRKSRSRRKARIQITPNPGANSLGSGGVGNNCSPRNSSACRGSLVIHSSCQCQPTD